MRVTTFTVQSAVGAALSAMACALAQAPAQLSAIGASRPAVEQKLKQGVIAQQSGDYGSAAGAFQEALRLGTPEQQQKARNNLGVLQLRQGNLKEALKSFADTDFERVDATQRYLYLYNYARALETDRNFGGALRRYAESVAQRPDYKAAVEGAFRVAAQISPPPVEDAAKLGELLATKGQAQQAAERMWQGLDAWALQSNAQRLLGALARSYAALPLDPPLFKSTEHAKLSALAGRNPALQRPVNDISRAYLATPEPVFNSAVLNSYVGWQRGTSSGESFSALLKSIADYHSGRKDFRSAASLYYAAWAFDPKNDEAALNAAAILRDHQEFDPQRGFFQELLRSLFEQKGEAYRNRDDLTILRMHTILGSVFEQEGRWANEYELHGATYHWKRAVEADSRLRQSNPEFPPSPGLHQHLANCYLRNSRNAEAFEQYASAAEGFLKLHQTTAAKDSYQRAVTLASSTTGNAQQRLETITRAIRDQDATP